MTKKPQTQESHSKESHPKRLRRLSEEEIDLWLDVAASITRRAGSTLPQRLAELEPLVTETPALAVPAPPLVARPAKPKAPPLAPLERKLKQKLTRGKMAADAAIDLHGFRQAEAYSALSHFLNRAHRDGARVVLVVTGKGGRSSDGLAMAGGEIGVLKRSVPLWLGPTGVSRDRPRPRGSRPAAWWRGGAVCKAEAAGAGVSSDKSASD